jgi:hypothetical protein
MVGANRMHFFLIDSLDIDVQLYMFNIFPLLNTAKIERKENVIETYEIHFPKQFLKKLLYELHVLYLYVFSHSYFPKYLS